MTGVKNGSILSSGGSAESRYAVRSQLALAKRRIRTGSWSFSVLGGLTLLLLLPNPRLGPGRRLESQPGLETRVHAGRTTKDGMGQITPFTKLGQRRQVFEGRWRVLLPDALANSRVGHSRNMLEPLDSIVVRYLGPADGKRLSELFS
jgi:hypothetical protein